jgi:Na+/proline symporter
MGAGGGFLLMLQLWMAVTATANSEQLAVASLITYDVYRTYINPKVRTAFAYYTYILHYIT